MESYKYSEKFRKAQTVNIWNISPNQTNHGVYFFDIWRYMVIKFQVNI